MASQNPKQSAPSETKPATPSRELLASVLAEAKVIEKDQENEKAGRVVRSRLLLAVGGAVRAYPNTRTKHSEGPEIPKSSLIWPGETVHEEMPGDLPIVLDNVFEGKTTPYWRPLTSAEEAVAVSDSMALRFLTEAENPALGADQFLASVREKNEATRSEIADLQRRLEEKQAVLATGLHAESGAEEFAATKAAERDAWAAKSGRSLDALRAVVELLKRPAPEAAPSRPMHTLPRPEAKVAASSGVEVVASA